MFKLDAETWDAGATTTMEAPPAPAAETRADRVAGAHATELQAGLISRLLVSVAKEELDDAMAVFRTLRTALGR